MTITPGFTQSFILEKSQAIHDLEDDTLKLALYGSAASLTPDATTAYTSSEEVSGTGYTAGGEAMAVSSGYPLTTSDGIVEYRFDSVVWGAGASFDTVYGGLIYNTSKSNRSIMILEFPLGRVISSATFTIAFPLTVPALMRFK